MHYYQFNIGDYASHTSRLTPIEDLAYRRMLDLYYLNEQPLNGCIADVAREIGLNEHKSEVEYILTKFFSETDKGFSQKRIDLEIKKYKSNAKNKSKAGIASAKARREKALNGGTPVEQPLNTDSTDEQLNNNQEPLNINHKPLNNSKEINELSTTGDLSKLSNDDIACAEWFFSLLQQMNPKHKKPNLNTWANDIRKIVNIDNRSYQEISDLMLWVNKDSFWQTNILSPKKLREKWDALTIQKNKVRHNKTEARTLNNLTVGEDFLNEH